MTKNPLIIDEITTLRLLHDLRSDMQQYSLGNNSASIRQNLLEVYNAFLSEDDRQRLNTAITQRLQNSVSGHPFNPLAYKPEPTKEDKKQQKEERRTAEQNKAIQQIMRQIRDEVNYQHIRGYMTDVTDDAEFQSISVNDTHFIVKVSGREEPLKFTCRQRNGKFFSALGFKALTDKKYSGMGFNTATHKLLSEADNGQINLITTPTAAPAAKKYTVTAYKSLLKLGHGDKLNQAQQRELEILNTLPTANQLRFITDVKKRTAAIALHDDFFRSLEQIDDKVLMLARPAQLQKLFVRANLPDISGDLQNNFIKTVIQKDKEHIWNNFSKNNGGQRFSAYDIMLSNLISRHKNIFQDLYATASSTDIQDSVRRGFQQIKSLSAPLLPDTLAAEIFTRGVFQEAFSNGTNPAKIKKMNQFLNEFGINIDLKQLPVTRIPDDNVKSGAEQLKIDRQNFEEDKKTPLFCEHEKQFQALLRGQHIENPDTVTTHHYFPLKYNGFVDQNLNNTRFYVMTARQNAWNTDGHDLVHTFDTAGEFLITGADNNYTLMDFNRLRNSFKHGEKPIILTPVLQIRDNNQGKFRDLLSCEAETGQKGCYISSDKSENNLIDIPQYCKELTPQAQNKLNKMQQNFMNCFTDSVALRSRNI